MPLSETPLVPLGTFLSHLRAHALARAPAPDMDLPDAELSSALHEAEEWAGRYSRAPLGPSAVSASAWCDRAGNVRLDRDPGRPVVRVQSVRYGPRDSEPVVIGNPRAVVGDDGPVLPGAIDRRHLAGIADPVIWVDCIAGWCTTVLSAASRPGDRVLTVEDTRWLTPGREYELLAHANRDLTVTVSPLWTPPWNIATPEPGQVLSAEPFHRPWHPCAVGTALSDLPAPVRLAVGNYAVAVLAARAKVRADEDEESFPDTALNAGTR